MPMSHEEREEFGELKAVTEHTAATLDEIAPMVRSMHAKMERQAGFVTGVAVTVSAAWAILVAAWVHFFGGKP